MSRVVKKPTKMTKKQQQTVTELREAGFAVIVWYPEELQGLDTRTMEDQSTEYGWELISDNGGEFIDPDEEEEDEE
jgi:hypothetical protein